MARLFGAAFILSIIGFWWVAGIWSYNHGGKLLRFKFSDLPAWIRIYGHAIAAIILVLVIMVLVDIAVSFSALL